MAKSAKRALKLPAYPKGMRREVRIAPSILAADFAELGRELRRCERARCPWIHMDIMDGHFVPNLTIGPQVVRALRNVSKRLFFDVHLMTERPMRLADAFVEAGAQSITVHQESLPRLKEALRNLHRLGVKAGVSIRPRTSPSVVEPLLDKLDLVLVMTVEPGFGGQDLIPSTLNKVRRLALLRQKENLNFHLQVDGGINVKTAPLAVAAGADVLVAGTAVFGNGKVADNIAALRESVDKALG